MKKSNKYNLLSKNESLKEKDQQDWVQLQSARKWQGKTINNDTSYMKFQQQQLSQIANDKVPLNKGNESSTFPVNKMNHSQSSGINKKRMADLQNQSQYKDSNLASQQKTNSKYQLRNQNPQLKSQLNPQQRLAQNTGQNFHPNAIQNTFNGYQQNYGTYQQSIYIPDQFYRQSQISYQPQIVYTQSNMYNQPYASQMNRSNIINNQPKLQQSALQSSSLRASTRMSIPEMTVNCDKCTFTQAVPGNSQMFICCLCNQISECFPLYGVFTCGICRANVIYPHGTSSLIKCTKCLTVNRVNPEPSKKIDQVVTMGKQRHQIEEEYIEIDRPSLQQKPAMKMSRNQPSDEEGQIQTVEPKQMDLKKVDDKKISPINQKKQLHSNFPEQPFKILPVKKEVKKEQVDFFTQNPSQQNKQPKIFQQKYLKRQQTQRQNLQFKEELIVLDRHSQIEQDNKVKLQSDKQREQLMELAKKLDEMQIQKQAQTRHNKTIEYPSIFDD